MSYVDLCEAVVNNPTTYTNPKELIEKDGFLIFPDEELTILKKSIELPNNHLQMSKLLFRVKISKTKKIEESEDEVESIHSKESTEETEESEDEEEEEELEEDED